MKSKNSKYKSTGAIFIIYTLIAFLLIMCFRFIFPAYPPPLPVFIREWRLLLGLLDFFTWFPALAFSALVISFSLINYEGSPARFSPDHFKRLTAPVSTAICMAIIYGIISFLVSPMVNNARENMIFRGEAYNFARERAEAHGMAREWQEARQFLIIADNVWPNSPALVTLRADIYAYLEERLYYERQAVVQAQEIETAPFQPPDVTQAIAMSEAAFQEGRYFDAHWLAILAGRLAIPGSPEEANAARLSSLIWNQINSLAPSQLDVRRFELFNKKRTGYQAMLSGDWIQAFYIFSELITLTPHDQDVVNFLAASETGVRELAFFIDEISLALGKTLTGAVFSLPGLQAGSRSVLRFSSLSILNDSAYGMDLEYKRFDANSNPLISLYARYAKLLPFTRNDRQQVMVQMRAIDRYDPDQSWGPQWLIGDGASSHIILDISFDDFALLSSVRYGISNLQINELFALSNVLDGRAGYVPQVFQAEILNRFGAMFFLPMAIFVIVLGWRSRPKGKQRYFFVLLFPFLPLVFHAFVLLYRLVLNTLGIWLTINIGFNAAVIALAIVFLLSFFASLILLAAQRE